MTLQRVYGPVPYCDYGRIWHMVPLMLNVVLKAVSVMDWDLYKDVTRLHIRSFEHGPQKL